MRLRPAPTRRRPGSSAVALLAVVLLGGAGPASAQKGNRKAPAKPASQSPAEDPRDAVAGRHFEAGQKLHHEGLFQEAIAEFQEAYRVKPHPNVLYNIGQAYERLLQYGDAVEWFERYLREGGEAAPYRMVVQNRLHVLRGLPARIHVECLPKATASVIDPDGVVEQAETPAEFRMKAGRYTLRVTRDGYVPQERRIGAEIGQPYFYQFTLEQQRELVTIRPNPAQARIFLDQKLVITGIYADRLPVGRHKLLVEYGRHEPFEGEFNLRPGRKIEYDIVLKPPPPQGRIEFVIGMGVYGAAVVPLVLYTAGALTRDMLNDTKRRLVLLPMVMGGAGLGSLAGFLATPRGIQEASSALILGGTTWGSMEGLSLGLLADRRNSRLVSGLTLGGSVVGLGTALLLVRPVSPTPGQAAIMNSGGFWGMALGVGLGYALRGDRHDLDLTLIIGLNIGLLTGGVMVNHFDLSRTRMFLIDVGTVAGAATGTLIGFAASRSDPFRSNIGAANLARGALVGGAVGLATAVVLTRTFDRRGTGTVARDSLVSLEHNSLHLGMPTAQVAPVPSPAGGTDLQVTLKLASGTF
jgi:hypothetical protein